MSPQQLRVALRERIERGASVEELDTMVRLAPGLGERQRAVLLGEIWRSDSRAITRRRLDAARSLLRRRRRR
jgi:hypothetical protein